MRLFILALTLLMVPSVASAQTVLDDTEWLVFGQVGFDPPLSGSATSAVAGTLIGAPLVLGNVSYSDVYGSLARWQFGAGYRLSNRSEVLAAFGYSSGGGSRALLGVAPGEPYVGEFESVGEKSFEIGYRYHIGSFGPFRPYVGGWGGFVRTNAISAPLSLPGSNAAPINLPVFDASAAAVISGNGGLLLPLTRRLALSIDANLRWRTSINSANVLVGTGLDNIGAGSARWSLPVVFGAVLRVGATQD